MAVVLDGNEGMAMERVVNRKWRADTLTQL